MKTTFTPEGVCPNCGKRHYAVTSVGEDVMPEPGQLTVRGHCTLITKFDANLELVALDQADLDRIARDERLRRTLCWAVAAVKRYHVRRAGRN